MSPLSPRRINGRQAGGVDSRFVSTRRIRAPLSAMNRPDLKKFLIGCALVVVVAVCAALLMR
jgi:hypothetical protein